MWIFLLILFARMILSWIPVLVREWEPRGPMWCGRDHLLTPTRRCAPCGRVLKPVRIGNIMLDLAFIGFSSGSAF